MFKCTPVEVLCWPTTPLSGLHYDYPYPSGSQHSVAIGNGQQILRMCSSTQYTGMHTRTLHVPGIFSLAPKPLPIFNITCRKKALPIFLYIGNSAVAWGRGYLALLLTNLVWLSSLTPLWGVVGRPLLHLPH